MDTIYSDNLTNVPLLQNLYPMMFCCTPAQFFVPQAIKVYPKKYRESLNYLLDKFKFTSSILSCTKCVDCIWDILNDG